MIRNAFLQHLDDLQLPDREEELVAKITAATNELVNTRAELLTIPELRLADPTKATKLANELRIRLITGYQVLQSAKSDKEAFDKYMRDNAVVLNRRKLERLMLCSNGKHTAYSTSKEINGKPVAITCKDCHQEFPLSDVKETPNKPIINIPTLHP